MCKKYMSSNNNKVTTQYEDIRVGLEALGKGIAFAGFILAAGLIIFGIIIMGV